MGKLMQIFAIVLLFLAGLSGSEYLCGKKHACFMPEEKVVARG
jgi:hypothetical protein